MFAIAGSMLIFPSLSGGDVLAVDHWRHPPAVHQHRDRATKNRRILESQAFATQSHWFNDPIVSTFGWRREESSTLRVSAPADPTGQAFVRVNDASYTLESPLLRARVSLKVQLNVRNLNTGDELKPVAADPDGAIVVWQIAEPRRHTLSATFGF